jgi:hypothetical protein
MKSDYSTEKMMMTFVTVDLAVSHLPRVSPESRFPHSMEQVGYLKDWRRVGPSAGKYQ